MRLAFLYPNLLRAANRAAQTTAHPRRSADAFRRVNSSFAPRHGKGVAPETWEEEQQHQKTDEGAEGAHKAEKPQGKDATRAGDERPAQPDTITIKPEAAAAESRAKTKTDDGGLQPDVILAAAPQSSPKTTTTTTTTTTSNSAGDRENKIQSRKGDSSSGQEPGTLKTEAAHAREAKEAAKSSGPLEVVLHRQTPEEVAKQHPAMSPPPYEHHFDSYSLVKQLEEGGYTPKQSVTAMKAIRQLLAKNLNVAQQSLVSKSDVENEAYLFSAACSELNAEVKNNRRLAEEELRQQRTHLQHEVDILTQSLNQEVATLNDTVKGMFNDRKQAVREEQKAMDSAIQKISYKISIDLTSDVKTDIEGVRWILIWRSVLGITFMALLTLGTLRLATYEKQRKLEEEHVRKTEEERRRQEQLHVWREEEEKKRVEEERRRKEEEDARREQEAKRREVETRLRREDEEEVRRLGPGRGRGGGSGGAGGGDGNGSGDGVAAEAVEDVESVSAS